MLIAPSVYFYPFISHMENNCNTVLIDGPEKLLIDPGHKHNWPKLKQQIAADRIDPSEIKLVLHTHCHPDHMEAGEILEADYGAVQAMSEIEREFLEGEGQKFFPWMGLDVPKGHIGRLLSEGDLDLGDKVLKLYLTPGHSPGSLCVHWPEAGVLVSGDLIFARSYGRTDFPGCDHDCLIDSIERMSQLEGIETLLPGHSVSVIGGKRVADNFRAVLSMLGR